MSNSRDESHSAGAMPIPDRLNRALVLVVFGVALALLWWCSHTPSIWALGAGGVLFSYVLLTNYSLLHEASHDNLQTEPTWNRALGTLAGFLFPFPYSMMHTMHWGHHLRNRTDYEMFDLYYPTDNRLVRFVQWYGILCGLFWPCIPLGALLFAVCPRVLRAPIFRRARSSSYLLADIDDCDVARFASRCCSRSRSSR